jgi:hypothetical protein
MFRNYAEIVILTEVRTFFLMILEEVGVNYSSSQDPSVWFRKNACDSLCSSPMQ